MTALYVILCTYFICNIILKIVSFGLYLNWDKDMPKKLRIIKYNKNEKLWIIIPVFKESDVIEKSYSYFSNIIDQSELNINVMYVGTEREKPNKTLNILKRISKNKKIHILNSDANKKFMAGQINYAIEYIDMQQKEYKFAIYNVDSRPDLKSLENNFKLLSEHLVVQQYGDYSNNIPRQSKSIRDFIYLNTFLWQNSWSKLFEIRNTVWNRFFKRLSKFSYVVGHGMFLNRNLLDITGMLSEKIQNEDMELSIRLHEHNISIESGYGFSKSDMPLNLNDYIKQQTVWSRGPMFAIKYAHNSKQILPAIKLFLHFIYWMFEPVFMLFLILISLFSGNMYMVFGTMLLFIIYFFCVLILPNKKYTSDAEKYPIKYTISCFLFFILHSFGPFIALKNFILEKIGLQKEQKFKTPKL